jgi:hypothetical protein
VKKATKAAGPVTLTVRPTGRSAKKLKADGQAKIAVRLTFVPATGDPSNRVVKLTLKLGGPG